MEVAYALLTTCFYLHNEKQHARPSRDRVRMVEEVSDEYCGEQEDTEEHFGLAFGTSSVIESNTTSEDINIVQAPYNKTVKRFMVSYMQLACTQSNAHIYSCISIHTHSSTPTYTCAHHPHTHILYCIPWPQVHNVYTLSSSNSYFI